MSYIQLSEANCRNCLRCVRICPTKAMTYQNHQPTIVENECILCGKCFLVCPHSAKKIVSDRRKVELWLQKGEQVILSVAPSFASIWPDYTALEHKLKELGFFLVEETAVGARMVSQAYLDLIEKKEQPNILSTCCPAVVTYIEKNYPDLTNQLAPVVSPMVAHAKNLKERYPHCKTVFLTPCIAKQKEAEEKRFDQAVDATLTMPDLTQWLSAQTLTQDNPPWQSLEASTTRLYPTPGGVLKTISQQAKGYTLVSAEGMDRVKSALDSIREGHLTGYFFELSACEQSCLGGPLLSHVEHNEWIGQSAIRRNASDEDGVKSACFPDMLKACWTPQPIIHPQHREEEILDTLFLMGKNHKSKELDCGACGYETCRQKAVAVLEDKADPKLCLPYALEHAQSISNLIIENTPNGILVLDSDYSIREMNPSAQHMLEVGDINPVGLPIETFLPDQELIKIIQNLEGVQYYRSEYPQYNKIFNHALISIEDRRYIIIILMDLTVEEIKEKVIRQMRMKTVDIAQTVIDDQMRVVQEIASLLGETTAKSKVALTRLMKAMDEDD